MNTSETLKKYVRQMAKTELNIMTANSDEERKKHEKKRDRIEKEILAILDDEKRSDDEVGSRRDKWHQ